MNNHNTNLPASFRVIGVGNDTEEIISCVKAFGFDGVNAEVIEYPYHCIPSDEDKLAVIVSINNGDQANIIAKCFHEAGVLTIGLSDGADSSCYDSVLIKPSSADYVEIVKTILQPLVTPGKICFGFNDMSTTLRDTGFFLVKNTIGDSVEECVTNIESFIKNIPVDEIQYISVHLYFNRERPTPLEVKDVAYLSEMSSSLPESIDIIWSVYSDNSLTDNQIRLATILSGKDLWKNSTK